MGSMSRDEFASTHPIPKFYLSVNIPIPEMVEAALRLGGRGYLLKSDAAELPFAIKTIF